MVHDGNLLILAVAIILSSGCTILGHIRSQQFSEIFAPVMILGGLGLGSVLLPDPYSNLCVLGVLSYAVYGLTRRWNPSFQNALCLGQLALAAMFCIIGLFTEDSVHIVEGLFLAVTFLPLTPFHLPFVTILRSSHEATTGLWVVVWLTLGLSQIHALQGSLPFDDMRIFNLVALGSAVYASLKALGQSSLRESMAYLTIAFLALLWGFISIFGSLANWAIPFGLAIEFLLGALLLAYSFLCHRYGKHGLNSLQGLGSGMPRFRALVTLVISLTMVLPILPVIFGLSSMPVGNHGGDTLSLVSISLLTVWMGSTWQLCRILDQTAFGKARIDITHEDLHLNEMVTMVLLIGAASLCGVLS